MLISELAAKAGVTIDTIRFYEKQGLLNEQHFVRGANRYRHYNDIAVQRLKLIQQAQAAGITLSEMRESVDAWELGEIDTEEKLDFFRRKLEQIDERIRALQEIKVYLQQKLQGVETEQRILEVER